MADSAANAAHVCMCKACLSNRNRITALRSFKIQKINYIIYMYKNVIIKTNFCTIQRRRDRVNLRTALGFPTTFCLLQLATRTPWTPSTWSVPRLHDMEHQMEEVQNLHNQHLLLHDPTVVLFPVPRTH
jgi:hypothetical protein